MFGERRPVEELYDTQADPYEIYNLAGDPAYAPELARMRGALDAWIDEVGDMGRSPESEMVAQWYPGGVQPRTAPVVFVPICEENPGQQVAPEGGTFEGPLLVQFYCATQGASMAYTFEEGEGVWWQLYTGPLRLPPGETAIRARAIRIGYQESEERAATFGVT